MDKENEIKKILNSFTPEEKGFAEAITTMKVENEAFKKQLAELKKAHDELYKVMITILHAQPEKELRIHKSQFLRFKEEYRMERFWDESLEEMVFKLKTLTDD